MAPPVSTTESGTGVYGLAQPTVAEVLAALERVHPQEAAQVTARLLAAAQLGGGETDRDSVERLLHVMRQDADRVTALCAVAMNIRLTTYDRLLAANAHLRNGAR